MQEIWQKLKTGLKDYLTASGFGEVLLGLSGGLDSALVAVLAADVLGGAKVRAVMMRTSYTSELSLQIARRIAAFNGLNYQELEIEPQVERRFWKPPGRKKRSRLCWKICRRGYAAKF